MKEPPMITAHLPAAWCMARPFRARARGIMAAALLGAVLPDLDLLFFYFVDGRSLHHHRYWVHVPAFWAAVAAIALPIARRGGWLGPALAFLGSVLLHMILDTTVGGIMWGAPLDTRLHRLVVVPASQPHWLLSFVLHWTFALEILVWIAFASILARDRFGKKTHRPHFPPSTPVDSTRGSP
jgi:hypothetical protein